MSKNYPEELNELISAAIEAAPQCLQNKALLQAIDWSKVDQDGVSRLFENLDNAKKKAPPWLLTALLVAGHPLNEARLERLSLPHKLLNHLNNPDFEGLSEANKNALRLTAKDVAARRVDQPDLVGALVRQLKSNHMPIEALDLALVNWRKSPQLLRFVSDELKSNKAGFLDVKIRMLGYSTTHPLAEDLIPAFASQSFEAHVVEANFGEVIPELLKPVEEAFDLYILMLDLEGFHPQDWRQDPAQNLKLLDERLDLLASALTGFITAKNLPVFINTLPLPASPAVGFLDHHHASGMAANIKHINRRLAELATAHNQITLIDSFGAMADLTPEEWVDPKMWFYGRIPFSAEAGRALAHAFAKAWRTEKKGPAKVLAIDLDNTMWGGIFGEDGVNGLQCGNDFPGNAFKAMQNEFLRLKNQGMLLTILSKNNPDAITAFADHQGIILNEDDFVGHRINWTPKPQNIKDLAADLNLGLDSFIFLDDSPHEREAMRALAPEVQTPELPDDPAQRPGWLRTLSNTWPTRLTAEDAKRSSMYLADKKAKDLKSSVASFDDYLKGLEQKLFLEEVSEATLPRIAQMHTRTNQFNLTTRRFDENDIKLMMNNPTENKVVFGRASDKFGDHGIVICAAVSISEDEATLDSLLMSCRVIGRQVETAFLGAVLALLEEQGVKSVSASYIPTVKNIIVADFYKEHGFVAKAAEGETTNWNWQSGNNPLPGSNFVKTNWQDT